MRPLRRWYDRHRHPGRYSRLASLLPIRTWSRAQVLERQWRDLEAMVRFAAHQTDFYAERLAPILSAVKDSIDIARIPVLEKRDVLDHLPAMLTRGADRQRVKVGHTGGSTGRPMAFYYDQAKHELMLAGMMRGFMMSGWRPGQRVLYLWAAARDVAPGGVFGGYGRGLLDVERAVDAVDCSEANLHRWAQIIRGWRPVLLYGYASVLGELARFVNDSGLRPRHAMLGVYSTAEVLHDWQRELIESAFGCKVFNQYGCREVPNIAWECRHGGMHVFTDMVYLESLASAEGERLLVTSLTNRLMPFIRYDTGDSGRLLEGDCPCGLPFPLMQMDMCRQNDLVRTRGGGRVHPAYFNRLLYGLTQIRHYQWVQTGPGSLRLNLVSERPLSAETLQSITQAIHRDLDPQMRLEVDYRDEIPRTPSGKHRFVIGLVNQPGSRGQGL